jgi:hypothetical protein
MEETMKTIKILGLVLSIIFILPQFVFTGDLEDIYKKLQTSSVSSLDDRTIISGLKEALSLGTAKAVNLVSVENGYLRNEAIKILLPEKIQMMSEALRAAGFNKEVDTFIVSMNRAAEKAAPKAKPILIAAIKEMSFQDARNILNGGSTAATEYFQGKTSTKLSAAFQPVISSSMNKTGVTKSYKALKNKYLSILPLSTTESIDLDRYVTTQALDGLFHMLGQEEAKIRTNPKARTTEILKKVFAK